MRETRRESRNVSLSPFKAQAGNELITAYNRNSQRMSSVSTQIQCQQFRLAQGSATDSVVDSLRELGLLKRGLTIHFTSLHFTSLHFTSWR